MFKRFVALLICVVLSVALIGCGDNFIPDPPPIIYVDSALESQEQPITIFHRHFFLQAGVASAAIPPAATEGRFIIGAWRSPLVARSQYEFARFTYEVERACQTLPQGDVVIAYELYDAAGNIVKQDDMQVSLQTCP